MRVSGDSMLPTLRPGQVVLVRRQEPKIGDIVVARHPQTGALIGKRLAAIEPDGYWLEGDAHIPATASSSSDSWVFGAVNRDAIVGVVLKLA